MAELANHLHIVSDALIKAVGFGHTAVGAEKVALVAEVNGNLVEGCGGALLGGDEDVCRVYLKGVEMLEDIAAQRVYGLDAFNLIAPERDAQTYVLEREHDVHGIPFHAKLTVHRVNVGAVIKRGNKFAQELVAGYVLSFPDFNHALREIVRIAHTVYARYGGDHHDVAAPGEQRCHGGEAELLDAVVYHQVFFYVFVR